jgi:acetoin utilization deacetylase AcuC-like enzyme
MSAMPKFRAVEDPRYRQHAGPSGHPERPERLAAVAEALDAFGEQIERVRPREAEAQEILRVHERALLDRVAATRKPGLSALDPDTYACSESYAAALLAAGGSIDLVRSVANGVVRSGMAAVRPPGHHAEAHKAMGFCLFNNVALAARALQAEDGVGKLAIVDWDVHHGNGTQHYFESDPSVLYASTHQFPYYPGTGATNEAGIDRGEGATVNIPMPAGCGDAEYVGAFQRIIQPVMLGFQPEMILVSCGFDSHLDDPLASMRVSAEGFSQMTRLMRALADEVCGGKIAFILEGGYALSGLREGTTAVVEAMLDDQPAVLPRAEDLEPGSMLRPIVEAVARVHRGRFDSLGAG